jgi:hypothetical protein
VEHQQVVTRVVRANPGNGECRHGLTKASE